MRRLGQSKPPRPAISWAMVSAGLAISLGFATSAYAGPNCYWPQQFSVGACTITGSLANTASTGWKNANGTTRTQVGVKASWFGGGSVARVRQSTGSGTVVNSVILTLGPGNPNPQFAFVVQNPVERRNDSTNLSGSGGTGTFTFSSLTP